MGVVFIGSILGIVFIYISKKSNIKLLFYWGLVSLFASLFWLGNMIDFIAIIITSINLNNSYGLIAILNYQFIGLACLIGTYIGAEL